MDHLREPVIITTGPTYDWDGKLISGPASRTVLAHVAPQGASDVDGVDFDGNTSRLDLLLHSGTPVEEGDLVEVRGLTYKVVFAPFDWGQHRRPAFSRHTPRLSIVVERTEA